MHKRKIITLFAFTMLLAMLIACANPTLTPATPIPRRANASNIVSPTVVARVTATASSTLSATGTVVPSKDHDVAGDYTWDTTSVVNVTLRGNSATVKGAGVQVDGNKVQIIAAGTYSFSGSLADGQIVVNTSDKGIVRLILNGVEIRSSTNAPIYIANAKKAMIVLADNTQNIVADAKTYTPTTEDDEPNATIFSKSDLTIYGKGVLTVEGNYNDGIASKDGLIIASGTLIVKAVDDGIRGKDYLVVKNGNITITAQGDGLKSDNADEAGRGYISIGDGAFNITAGGDAIAAQTSVQIVKGKFNLVAGGGSKSRVAADLSAKGIKAVTNVTINGGTFQIDSADDAIHANDSIIINDGTFVIATGDDAIHADTTVTLNAGIINITQSYEGIESASITINGGEIRIVSSDDGLNAAGGRDGSGMMPGPGIAPGPGGFLGRGFGRDMFAAASKYTLYIHGGYIVVDAMGDCMDINGSIEMTGGTVIGHGPIVQMNSAVDYDVAFKMTGGLLIAVGSSGMAQAPDASSTQNALLLNFTAVQRAGTLIHIQTSDGKDILTFAPTKQYQSIAFSSPELVKDVTYDVYLGGTSTGILKDGVYQGGTYQPGTKNTTFTVTSVVTRLGAPTRFPMR